MQSCLSLGLHMQANISAEHVVEKHWLNEFRGLHLSQGLKEIPRIQQVGTSCHLPPFYGVGQNHNTDRNSI